MEEHEPDDRRRTVLKMLGGTTAVGAFGAPSTASANEETPSSDDHHDAIPYDIRVKNNGVTGDDIRVRVSRKGGPDEYARRFTLPALKERPDDDPGLSAASDDVDLRGGADYEVTVTTPDGEVTETFDVPPGGIDAYNAVLVSRRPDGSTSISWVVV